jgi:hypothetical protein
MKPVRAGETLEDSTPRKKHKSSIAREYEFVPILSDQELAPCEFTDAFVIEVS